MSKLAAILSKMQKTINAPKSQFNKFGGYNYRNCEDILCGIKHVMPDDCYVTMKDDIILIMDRVYVKATATLSDGQQCIEATAFAREATEKKGMDAAQITGSTSSYARKYALGALFAIDDSKLEPACDPDSMDNRQIKAPVAPNDNIMSEIEHQILNEKTKAALRVTNERLKTEHPTLRNKIHNLCMAHSQTLAE